MATIQPTIDRDTVPGAVLATWADLATGDVGAGVPVAYSADLTGQASGTFGGATITWEGSNDGGTTWLPLTDPQGNAIAKTADSLEAVTEISELARPRVSSGAVTAVTISAILRRQQPLRS